MRKNNNPTPWRTNTQNYLIGKWFADNPNKWCDQFTIEYFCGSRKAATRIGEVERKLGVKFEHVLAKSETTNSKYEVYRSSKETSDYLKQKFYN